MGQSEDSTDTGGPVLLVLTTNLALCFTLFSPTWISFWCYFTPLHFNFLFPSLQFFRLPLINWKICKPFSILIVFLFIKPLWNVNFWIKMYKRLMNLTTQETAFITVSKQCRLQSHITMRLATGSVGVLSGEWAWPPASWSALSLRACFTYLTHEQRPRCIASGRDSSHWGHRMHLQREKSHQMSVYSIDRQQIMKY